MVTENILWIIMEIFSYLYVWVFLFSWILIMFNQFGNYSRHQGFTQLFKGLEADWFSFYYFVMFFESVCLNFLHRFFFIVQHLRSDNYTYVIFYSGLSSPECLNRDSEKGFERSLIESWVGLIVSSGNQKIFSFGLQQ